MAESNDLINRYYGALAAGDLDGLLAMYADESEIVRYDGVAITDDEHRAYFEQHLARHPGLGLNQIVEVRRADDVLMWDALVDTDLGVVQVFHVLVLDADDRIRRHIPGLRGFWGG